jgi:hypothetical protein
VHGRGDGVHHVNSSQVKIFPLIRSMLGVIEGESLGFNRHDVQEGISRKAVLCLRYTDVVLKIVFESHLSHRECPLLHDLADVT